MTVPPILPRRPRRRPGLHKSRGNTAGTVRPLTPHATVARTGCSAMPRHRSGQAAPGRRAGRGGGADPAGLSHHHHSPAVTAGDAHRGHVSAQSAVIRGGVGAGREPAEHRAVGGLVRGDLARRFLARSTSPLPRKGVEHLWRPPRRRLPPSPAPAPTAVQCACERTTCPALVSAEPCFPGRGFGRPGGSGQGFARSPTGHSGHSVADIRERSPSSRMPHPGVRGTAMLASEECDISHSAHPPIPTPEERHP